MKNGYKLLYCIFIILIFIIINILIRSYFTPIFFIIILYIIASPMYKQVKGCMKSNRLASLITILILNIILIFTLFYLGSYIIITVDKLINSLLNNILIKSIILKLNFNIDIIWDNLSSIANPLVLKGAAFTGDALITYFISNVSVFFLLSDREEFINFIKLFLSSGFISKVKENTKSIKKILTLEVILVLFSLLQTMVGFIILRIPDGIILSILCGFLDILPYVGTFIVFAPLIIYNILVKDYITAVGLLSLYTLVSVIRQLLEAKYIGDNFSIHPLVIILSLYIGIQLFGLSGILLGPLYVIITKEVIFN
ncbi:AI-2E family transporter [Alloiococcus sp. CFN-8]|uniref:AI-2E family transporter n=1 Tax=Alloiococcus sp. CFN-8 TaxID=3416081 RepID=UPI003CF3E7E3